MRLIAIRWWYPTGASGPIPREWVVIGGPLDGCFVTAIRP